MYPMNIIKRRKSYTTSKKLEVITYAKIHGKREAARHFDVNEKSVREWLKQEIVLQNMPNTKRARRGHKARWPGIENKLFEWVTDMRREKRGVSITAIKLKALSIANELEISECKFSGKWCHNFMRRNNLSLRAVTSTGQKLPDDWIEKLESYKLYLKESIKDVELKHIGNVDEVAMCFDMPTNYTVEKIGCNDVKISTTGSERSGFTVVLCVTSDGNKLPPLVVFKRKTIPKEKFPAGIIVRANEKGWINENMFNDWINEVWKKRPCSFFNPKSTLILDSAQAHITESVKKSLQFSTSLVVIPGGMTKLLQPLDISVNRSFKLKIRQEWENWMIEGYHTYTKTGKLKRASYTTVCEWIVKSFYSISNICVINGF